MLDEDRSNQDEEESHLGRDGRRPRLLDLVWAMDPLTFETPWTLPCNTTLRLPNKADLLFLVLTR